MNTGLIVKLLVGVDKLIGGTTHAVASCSDCKGLELLDGCLLCDVDCVCWCLHIS